MKFILFAFLVIGLMTVVFKAQMPPIEPGVSQELAKWRAARYSDVRYKLNLTLEKMSPVLRGTIEIRVKHVFVTETEPTPKFIVLDWRKIKGFEDRSSVSNVSVNGRAASKENHPVGETDTPPS